MLQTFKKTNNGLKTILFTLLGCYNTWTTSKALLRRYKRFILTFFYHDNRHYLIFIRRLTARPSYVSTTTMVLQRCSRTQTKVLPANVRAVKSINTARNFKQIWPHAHLDTPNSIILLGVAIKAVKRGFSIVSVS